MAVSNDGGRQENDDEEMQSQKEMVGICAQIAREMAHNLDQVSESHPDRDDLWGFDVEHPVTPVTVYTKRGVTDDGWGYVYDRIHVKISADSIGTSQIMDIKRQHDLEVVDIWQFNKNETEEMGQHDRPAIMFALEPRE